MTHSKIQNQEDAKLSIVIYAFFLAAMIIDIGGAFGLKYASFAILVIYLAAISFTKGIRIPSSFFVLEGTLFVIAPIFFLMLAISEFSVAPTAAVREVLPFAIWLLFPLLLQMGQKEKITSIFTTALFLGAIFIIIFFIIIFGLHLAGQDNLITSIYMFTSKYELGYFGIKPFNGSSSMFFPNVYPRWTLLLIPAAILLLHENMKRFIIVVLATLLTTSTAAILFLLIGIIWASFAGIWKRRLSRLYFKKFAALCLLLLLCSSIIYLSGFEYIIEFIASKLGESTSTSIKIGHITSILALVSKKMTILFFGMGLGSSFWSAGLNEVVTNVEVSHFNLLRQFGLPYALAFSSYIFFLFIKLYKIGDEIGRLLSIGLIVLFIAAGTNPVLISPIFFLIVVISRAYITLAAREKNEYIKSNSISQAGV